MLSSVPARLIVRRSRSLSPSTRVFQTNNVNAPTCHGIREKQAVLHRNIVVSDSRVSIRAILDDKSPSANVNDLVEYHHLAPKWLSNLDSRRRSWAALSSQGRNKNHYEPSRTGLASFGFLSAAAVAFCLNKDSDNKGREYRVIF